jgi:hypothetical protein
MMQVSLKQLDHSGMVVGWVGTRIRKREVEIWPSDWLVHWAVSRNSSVTLIMTHIGFKSLRRNYRLAISDI